MPRRAEYQGDAACPLDGIRVLDLSRVVAGNALTALLGDFGAEVIKVERPGRGDDLRNWRVEGVSTYWKAYARNKKSLSLSMREAKGRELLLRLVPTATALVENYRPGRLEAMGLGPDVLWQANPDLVIVRVTGWGQDGPFRDKPGFGSLVEALSGFAAMTGFADREPVLPPLALADQVAGLYGAAAFLIALRQIEVRGGHGQIVDLPLFDPLLSILGPLAANYQLKGAVEPRVGSRSNTTAPRNVYPTKDGGFAALSASTQGMFERLMRSIGHGDLIDDPRFLANADRIRNVEALDAVIGGWIGARTLAENVAFFEEEGVTVGAVADISDLMEHPFITDRGILLEFPDEEMGSMAMHGIPARLSETPGAIRRPAPEVGQHNAEILGEIGLHPDDLATLAENGVI
ncbi:MAG: CoA transferase [Alphaproteobacteria bacterium]|nr:CoA transferase [Alphaproteobacteria bacterium]